MSKKRPRVSQNKRKDVYARDRGRCAYCGRLLPYIEFEVDHKTPISPDNEREPGTNELDNLQVTCRSCNEDKGALTDDEYRAALSSRAERSMDAERRVATFRDDSGHFDFYAAYDAMRKEHLAEREQHAHREYDAESTQAIMQRAMEP